MCKRIMLAFFSGEVKSCIWGTKIVTFEDYVNMHKVKECNHPNDYSQKVARKRKMNLGSIGPRCELRVVGHL